MPKPTAIKKRELPSDDRLELKSYLTPNEVRTGPVLPYLKSFIADKSQTEVRGSILRYTACSNKKWPAPKGDTNAA